VRCFASLDYCVSSHTGSRPDIITHLGLCSSTDTRAVNRIVVAEYVTASQAQRKWFTKVISKATKGAYSLGAVRLLPSFLSVSDLTTAQIQDSANIVRAAYRRSYGAC